MTLCLAVLMLAIKEVEFGYNLWKSFILFYVKHVKTVNPQVNCVPIPQKHLSDINDADLVSFLVTLSI